MSRSFELLQRLQRESDPKIPMPRLLRKPEHSHGVVPRHVPLLDAGAAGEEIVALVQRVFFLSEEPPRVVMISGVDAEAGVVAIASWTAEVLASQVKRRVCLLELRPSTLRVADMFGDQMPRLRESLEDEGIRSLSTQIGGGNLWIAASGPHPDRDYETIRARLSNASSDNDYVIAVLPIATQAAEFVALARNTDGVVIVINANDTSRERAVSLKSQLDSAGVRIMGAVLNNLELPMPSQIYKRLPKL